MYAYVYTAPLPPSQADASGAKLQLWLMADSGCAVRFLLTHSIASPPESTGAFCVIPVMSLVATRSEKALVQFDRVLEFASRALSNLPGDDVCRAGTLQDALNWADALLKRHLTIPSL